MSGAPDISAYSAERIIAYAAAHGATAARALAPSHRLTPAQIDRFCRDNAVAIKRARLVQLGSGKR